MSIEKGENGLKVSEGKYVVECPCCGETTTPEVDEAGTRYPCCGNEFPDAPPGWEHLKKIQKRREKW